MSFIKVKMQPFFWQNQFFLKNSSLRATQIILKKITIPYVRKGIIAKRIKQFEEASGETVCLEFTLSKKKWCILFVYRPPQNNNKASLFNEISINLNQITNNFIIMRDLNIDQLIKPKAHVTTYLIYVILFPWQIL